MSEKAMETGNEQQVPDPKKFFNEEQYNTIKIEGGKEKEKDSVSKGLLALLNSKTTGEKDIALSLLKKENAAALLIEAINASKSSKNKALLVAACWESGLDFKKYLDLFANLVHHEDLFVSMEAITVISENLTGLEEKQSEKLIAAMSKAAEDHFNADLVQDVIERLKNKE